MAHRVTSLLLVAASAWSLQLHAAGRGQGAIVLRDDAPVYAHSEGNEIEWKLKRGDAVAGFTVDVLGSSLFLFDEVKGRLHVIYFQGEQKGMSRGAWMNPNDLSKFTYDGGCEKNASPLTAKAFSQRWNACFEEGRDNKLEVLRARWEQEDAAPRTPTPTPTPLPPPPPLTVGCNLYGNDGGVMGTAQEIGVDSVLVLLNNGVKITLPLEVAKAKTRPPMN